MWNTVDDTLNNRCTSCQQYLEKDKLTYINRKRVVDVKLRKMNKTIFSIKKTDPIWLKQLKTLFRKINFSFLVIFLILTFIIILTHA
jgi:hypothetical protein